MTRIALVLMLVACGARDSLEEQRPDGGASGSTDSTTGGSAPGPGPGPGPGGAGPGPGGAGPGSGGFGGAGPGSGGFGGSGSGSGGFGGAGGAEPTSVVQLCAGLDHTCARLDTGDVRCWGRPPALGYGNLNNIGDDETPASAGNVDVGGPVEQIACGTYDTTCALLTTGAVRCWGQTTQGTIGDDETPASAGDIELGGAATQVAAGGYHTCAVLSGGGVRCWGEAVVNGHPTVIGDDETPASAGDVDVGGAVTQLAAGWLHTCALLTTGSVRCWGFGENGALGYGNNLDIGDDETPASAGDVDIGGVVTQIVAGVRHTCALLSSGDVRCWGQGFYNVLGYGDSKYGIGDDETPASAGSVDVGGTVAQIAAGYFFTCALLTTGAVRCWGWGPYGHLGYPNTTEVFGAPASAPAVEVGGVVTQLIAGPAHTCALLESGDVRCWGYGASGELGYGNTENVGDDETPAAAGSVQVL